MVALLIKDPNLPTGYEILSNSWWLSSTPEFGELDIIAVSLEDTINKLNIQFDVELEVNKKYYAKCRIVYNKGFSNDSNINVFIARDLNEIVLDMAAPTKISRPTISISPEGNFKPLGLLTFNGGDFISKFDVEHLSSSWILEDLKTSKVIWSKIENSDNLLSVTLPINLESNSAYRITLAYRGKNNNLSQFATKTFVTGDNTVNIKGSLVSVPSGVNLPIEVDVSEAGIDTIEYKLYANGIFLVDSLILSTSSGDDTRLYTIDGSLLSTDVDYTLHVQITESTEIKKNGYFYFRPYFDLSKTPDPNIKYENKINEYSPTYTAENFSGSTGFRQELPNNEIMQIVSMYGNISLNFYKLDSTNGRFDYTGRSYTLGVLKSSALAVDTSFSYLLMNNGKMIIKGHISGILLSIPYNVISGELDISLIRYTFGLGEVESVSKMQHGVIAVDDNAFMAFSQENGRLALVNSLDLSFTLLGSKVYDYAKESIGIYRMSTVLIFILYLDVSGSYKVDIFNTSTNLIITEGITIFDPTSNPENIKFLDNGVNFKMVVLHNGRILVVLTNTSGSNVYKIYNTELNTLTPLLIKPIGIGAGVYSLLRNGNLLQLSELKEIIFY